jgi:hypothetical protein
MRLRLGTTGWDVALTIVTVVVAFAAALWLAGRL